jgi:SulP family sulfate permease
MARRAAIRAGLHEPGEAAPPKNAHPLRHARDRWTRCCGNARRGASASGRPAIGAGTTLLKSPGLQAILPHLAWAGHDFADRRKSLMMWRPNPMPRRLPGWRQEMRWVPKSVVCLRQGYSREQLLRDLLAGLTVGVIALPLAIAFGVASIPANVAAEVGLSPPAMGLYTAVVAGFLISALGGSRVQIGGPTGAFIVIVYSIASKHGYAGLATATLMAGVILIIMGLSRFGGMIKFIPYPVTTGFTTGIAVIIFAGQLNDFLGLQLPEVPTDFVEKLRAYAEHLGTADTNTFAVGAASLLLLILLRRFAPRLPWGILTVIAGAAVVAILQLPVETIGSRFGDIPRSLPTPHWPGLSLELVRDLVPEATTIAILAAIESLLSAVVADGMIEDRHHADNELVAQGLANVTSILFGGIPATGAIARTAANVKSGGRTPVSGMVHAVTLLMLMLLAAPLAKLIPLATLAAVLMIVAWNMSEFHHFRQLLKTQKSDIAVLLTTFGLTVFMDLTIAVGVGMVLASILFMKRMADVSNVSAITRELDSPDDVIAELKDPNSIARRDVPEGVEVYEINGPFFFGVADKLQDTLRNLERPPRIFVLRLRRVPAIDSTGLHALEEFHRRCRRQGTHLLLSGVHAQPLIAFVQSGFDKIVGEENIFLNVDDAMNQARGLLGMPPQSRVPGAIPEVIRDRPRT